MEDKDRELPKIQLYTLKWVKGRSLYDRRRIDWHRYAGELVKEAECHIGIDGSIELLEEFIIPKGEWYLCTPSQGSISFVALRKMSLDSIKAD